MAKKKSIAKIKSKKPVLKTGNLPATQAMLSTFHQKIKSDIKSTEKKLEAKINQVESKINQVESKIELVLSEINRMAILMEEQNSRNKFVLDGYASLYDRQDRLETRMNSHVQDIESFILKQRAVKDN